MVEVLPFPDYSPENITEFYGGSIPYEFTGEQSDVQRQEPHPATQRPDRIYPSPETPITNLEMVNYANNINSRLDLLRLEATLPQIPVKKRPIFGRNSKPLHTLTMREIINRESEQGAQLFEKPTRGERVEFYYLGEGAWIWHQETKDDQGKVKIQTTRYEVKDSAVVKAQDAKKREYMGDAQLHNLALWMFNYYELVARNVYNREPGTNRHLSNQEAA